MWCWKWQHTSYKNTGVVIRIGHLLQLSIQPQQHRDADNSIYYLVLSVNKGLEFERNLKKKDTEIRPEDGQCFRWAGHPYGKNITKPVLESTN